MFLQKVHVENFLQKNQQFLEKVFDMDFLQKYLYGVFELPLPRNAKSRNVPTALSSISRQTKKIPDRYCQFFLDFFVFIAFSGYYQRWEFKNTTKNVLQKIVSQSFYKTIDTKSKTYFFIDFFVTFFWRFSVRGVQKPFKTKHPGGKKSGLVLFFDSDLPTHGGPRFFGRFGGPLSRE
jgi:hypothetical protein